MMDTTPETLHSFAIAVKSVDTNIPEYVAPHYLILPATNPPYQLPPNVPLLRAPVPIHADDRRAGRPRGRAGDP